MKRALVCVLAVLLFWIYKFIQIILISTGTLTGPVYGFAVDSRGDVYLGLREHIAVYQNGTETRQVQWPLGSSRCSFYIENDTLITSISEDKPHCGEYDLDGHFLRASKLSADRVWRTASKKTVYYDKNGNEYVFRKNNFLRPWQVLRNGEIIWQMSSADYLFYGGPQTLFFVIDFFIMIVGLLLLFEDRVQGKGLWKGYKPNSW